MLAVLEAFFVISVVIAVGMIVGRTGVLGDNARMVLNRVAFHVGVPALLLINLSQATLDQIFSVPLAISALAALAMFGLCQAVMKLLRRRGHGDAAIASWTASYVNAGNLGIPLSVYVFDSTTEISAIIVFQVVVLAPIGIAMLNSEATPPRSARQQTVALVRNPIIAASAIGLILAAVGVDLPEAIEDPLQLLADLAIPTVLLAFGIALSSRTADMAAASRVDVVITVVMKTILMPLVAFVVATFAFDATPAQVLLVTALAALPSAQNINTYAAVYRRSEALARDSTLISTLVSIPIIVAIVAILS